MKYLIVLCAILVSVMADWTPHGQKQLNKDQEECYKELNLSPATIRKTEQRIYDAEDAMCYVRCVNIKLGIWDDNEGFNIDRLYETIKAEGGKADKEDLIKCNNRVMDVSNCKWATISMQCIWDHKFISNNNERKRK